MILPILLYEVTSLIISGIIVYHEGWPFPFFPFLVAGVQFLCTVIPTVYFQIPKELREKPGFFNRFVTAALYPALSYALYFCLLLFYLAISYSKSKPWLQLIVFIVLLVVTKFSVFLKSNLVFKRLFNNQISAKNGQCNMKLNPSACSKVHLYTMLALFEHDTIEQIYFCTLIPHMQLWVILVAKIIENFVIAMPIFVSAKAAFRTFKTSVVDLFSPVDKIESVTDPCNDSGNDEDSVKQCILLYYTYILCEIYSTIFFTIVIPSLYFGPNECDDLGSIYLNLDPTCIVIRKSQDL
ncbi:hypothetical protein BKA69DRAFT_1072495 [Paraphysoderma sedebokerense]|nr:hypothetical protein BKA69DRAFT_1072495 [Paraphysoderma sedebokerense]